MRKLLALLLLSFITPAPAWNPTAGDYSRREASDVRVLVWNLHQVFPSDTTLLDNFTRVMQAIDPDVMMLCEIVDGDSVATLKAQFDSILPRPAGETWTLQLGKTDGYSRTLLVSRFPLTQTATDTIPASEVRGVNCARVNLPDSQYGQDFYVMGIHFKAYSGGTNTTRRQQACDAIAKWFHDLRTPGGEVTLPATMPIIMAGDTNFVDSNPQQPEVTLRTGDIVDNSTYGADVKGDWDNSDLTDLTPRNPINNSTVTYPSSSRIDRVYYTDSVATIPTSFVFNTLTMTSAQRTAAGVQTRDTTDASDHLPVVFDLRLPLVPVELSSFCIE